MSYILNALRKSEQERQAKQPETVTEQILHQPPQKKRNPTGWVAGIVAANLVIIALLVLYLKKPDDEPVQKIQVADQKNQAKPLNAMKKADEIKDERLQEKPEALTEAIKSEPRAAVKESAKIPAASLKSPSIEELAAAREAAAKLNLVDAKVASAPPAKSESRTPSSGHGKAVRQQVEAKQDKKPRKTQSLLLPRPETELTEEPVLPEIKPAKQSKEIPFFSDLPYDFRNSAPKMTINVFVYAERPDDRFVVMNMEKYKAGQTTKDAVLIKEIRPDSVVASYGGRTFRLERP